MRRVVVLLAGLASGPLAALACADGFDDRTVAPMPEEAAADAAPVLGDEGVAPFVDAEVPLGDVCGDREGLEPSAAWPLLGGCPTRSGVAPRPGPQEATVRWSTPVAAGETSPAVGASGRQGGRVGGAIVTSPVIAGDGAIVLGTSDGRVVAVFRDGVIKWERPVEGSPTSAAIGAAGRVHVGTSRGRLVALAPDTGDIVWAYELGGAAGSPVVGGDGTVYIADASGRLHAVGPDGTRRWIYAAGGPITGAPAVRGGVVYVGSADRRLHAVSTVDGRARFTYETAGEVATPLIASDGVVYVGSSDGRVYAITPSGLLLFAVNVRGPVRGAPALGADGTLFVTTNGAVVAIGP